MAEFTAQSRRQLIETGTKVPVQPEVGWGGMTVRVDRRVSRSEGYVVRSKY